MAEREVMTRRTLARRGHTGKAMGVSEAIGQGFPPSPRNRAFFPGALRPHCRPWHSPPPLPWGLVRGAERAKVPIYRSAGTDRRPAMTGACAVRYLVARLMVLGLVPDHG